MFAASFFDDFFGNSCLLFIVIVWFIGWVICKAAQNEVVQDAAKFTFWSWFLSDDDEY